MLVMNASESADLHANWKNFGVRIHFSSFECRVRFVETTKSLTRHIASGNYTENPRPLFTEMA